MAAQIIDGKAAAAELRKIVARDVAILAARALKPGLAVVLVGNDPASKVYVRSKAKQTVKTGMASFERRLPEDVTQTELLASMPTKCFARSIRPRTSMEPRCGRRGKNAPRWRCRLRRSPRYRRSDHACPGRRGSDDDCLPAQKFR